MPSPFPGMNPYLENPDVWSTFHTQAMTAMAERLSVQVRPDYIVHMEALPASGRRSRGSAQAAIGADVALIERQRYVEIRGRHNRALIAIIELLSPANKNPGPDRDQYLAKRAEILAGPCALRRDRPDTCRPSHARSGPSEKRVWNHGQPGGGAAGC